MQIFEGVLMVIISVIIPVYNVEKYLPKCLDSLAGQTILESEYICIDDGSTDSSLEICKGYAQNDSRFKVITQENGGPAKARNIALDVASGAYICFVDSDDYLEPGALEKLLILAKGDDYDVVVYGANVICNDDIPEWIKKATSPRSITYNNFRFETIFNEQGCRPFLWQHFIKSDLIKEKKLRLDESLQIGEDQAFEIVYFSYANKVLFTSEKLYNYRISRPGSQMDVWFNNPRGKMWQHIKMISYVTSELEEKVRANEEIVLINWIIETIYWDMSKLLYYDQAEYIFDIFNLLNRLNVYGHYDELSDFDKIRFKHLEAVYLHHEEPDKIIESMKQIGLPIRNTIYRLESNKILILYKRVRKFLGI